MRGDPRWPNPAEALVGARVVMRWLCASRHLSADRHVLLSRSHTATYLRLVSASCGRFSFYLPIYICVCVCLLYVWVGAFCTSSIGGRNRTDGCAQGGTVEARYIMGDCMSWGAVLVTFGNPTFAHRDALYPARVSQPQGSWERDPRTRRAASGGWWRAPPAAPPSVPAMCCRELRCRELRCRGCRGLRRTGLW